MYTQFSRHVESRLTVFPCAIHLPRKIINYDEMNINRNMIQRFAMILNLNNYIFPFSDYLANKTRPITNAPCHKAWKKTEKNQSAYEIVLLNYCELSGCFKCKRKWQQLFIYPNNEKHYLSSHWLGLICSKVL